MFCQRCGAELRSTAKFCSKCGQTTSTPPVTPVAQPSGGYERDCGIWNPNAASNWSLLFTPAFGSYLHAVNWRNLGEPEKAKSSMGWFYLSIAMLGFYILIGFVMRNPEEADSAARGAGFLYLLLWYFSAGRAQAKYVKEKFGSNYSRRSWGRPVFLGVLAITCYVFVSFAVADVWQKFLHDAELSGATSSTQAKNKYGFGINSRVEYEDAVRSYSSRIRSGELHVFKATPTAYLDAGDLALTKEELKSLDLLWYYEGNDIYMIISNSHPHFSIGKIAIGVNHGACGTLDQTYYPIDLRVFISPGHFAASKLPNDALWRFSYETYGRLNEEEQVRFSPERNRRNDCLDIVGAWRNSQ